jgi:hypothetical protein
MVKKSIFSQEWMRIRTRVDANGFGKYRSRCEQLGEIAPWPDPIGRGAMLNRCTSQKKNH